MASQTVALATPFARHDTLEKNLKELPGLEVVRFRGPDTLTVQALRALSPRYVFFPHWSWKIPREIHDAFECVIFHMTDVPFGRGGSPLQNLISRGIYRTKLSALRCVEEMDAGPVYLKRDLSLDGSAEEILARANEMIGEMIRTMLDEKPIPTTQVGDIMIFKRRTPKDGNLVGLETLQKIFDFIRMLDADGYPRAFLEIGDLKLEFSRAVLRADAVEASVRITQREKI